MALSFILFAFFFCYEIWSCGFLLLVLCLIQTQQVREEWKIWGWVWPRDWKWLRWNEVRWTEGTELFCWMCILVQAWRIGVYLAGWKGWMNMRGACGLEGSQGRSW